MVRTNNGEVLAERAEWARGALQRMRGLLYRPPLEPGEALILRPAAQIHTFGMRSAVDVVFCSASWVVLHVVRELRPWRVTRWVRGARYAVEFPAGTVGRELAPGEPLTVTSG